MIRPSIVPLTAFVGVTALFCLSACDTSDSNSSSKINGSVHMTADKPAEALDTVNGSIRLDDNATATSSSTVNGNIHLGAHSKSDSANTVNGGIVLDLGARVSGSLNTVNGSITLNDGVDVGGGVSNVNGKIELKSAHVAGRLKTASGGISVLGSSSVEGGIVVEKPGNEIIHLSDDVPIIIIGPGASVQGDLRFERAVKLYVSDKATIGAVTGATAIPFSGDAPPPR